MGLFDKLFHTKSKAANPDNTRLLQLLKIYQAHKENGESYKNVVLELMNGNSFLLLPSQNDNEGSGAWTTIEKDKTINLTSVYNLDGLKVLGAFTDEKSLLSWSKERTQYTALPTKDVLKLCEEQMIERIVINSNLPSMFVLERNRVGIKTETIKEGTTVQVGTPSRPLERRILEKLITQFRRVLTIDEVYQYGQTRNNEFSIVLGFKLSTNSENAKTAAINAVQTALQGEKLDQPLDIIFIQDVAWYQTIRNVENSFFYKEGM